MMTLPKFPEVVKGWEVFLPPPSNRKKKWLSLNDRSHWSRSSPLTKYWRTIGYEICGAAGIPTLEQAWVIANISFGDNRRRDVHNYMPTVKAVIDGCTDAGLWTDDRDGILIGPDMRRVEIRRTIGIFLNVLEVRA